MAIFTVTSNPYYIYRVRNADPSSTHFLPRPGNLHCRTRTSKNASICSFKGFKRQNYHEMRKLRSVEEENIVTEEELVVEQPAEEKKQQQETVSVPVSPSDKLTMFFQADGTLNEMAIPTVAKALEGTEGISNLKVQVSEGIATVELTKQTTVQATGVASSLVEIIQGAGFKLQTLNLSFDEEEELLV